MLHTGHGTLSIELKWTKQTGSNLHSGLTAMPFFQSILLTLLPCNETSFTEIHTLHWLYNSFAYFGITCTCTRTGVCVCVIFWQECWPYFYAVQYMSLNMRLNLRKLETQKEQQNNTTNALYHRILRWTIKIHGFVVKYYTHVDRHLKQPWMILHHNQ